MFIAIEKNIHVRINIKQITNMLKGTIRFNDDKGFYVEHSPKNIYANCGGAQIVRTFYQELMLNPFTEGLTYKDGDEVMFNKELYIDNGGSFYFAEIIEC
jgi:hypothetical protein